MTRIFKVLRILFSFQKENEMLDVNPKLFVNSVMSFLNKKKKYKEKNVKNFMKKLYDIEKERGNESNLIN